MTYLYGLAEPHLVRKDAVDPLVVQAAQPVHPLPLVGLQLALQLALGSLHRHQVISSRFVILVRFFYKATYIIQQGVFVSFFFKASVRPLTFKYNENLTSDGPINNIKLIVSRNCCYLRNG
jgi:hypothetical protein